MLLPAIVIFAVCRSPAAFPLRTLYALNKAAIAIYRRLWAVSASLLRACQLSVIRRLSLACRRSDQGAGGQAVSRRACLHCQEWVQEGTAAAVLAGTMAPTSDVQQRAVQALDAAQALVVVLKVCGQRYRHPVARRHLLDVRRSVEAHVLHIPGACR